MRLPAHAHILFWRTGLCRGGHPEPEGGRRAVAAGGRRGAAPLGGRPARRFPERAGRAAPQHATAGRPGHVLRSAEVCRAVLSAACGGSLCMLQHMTSAAFRLGTSPLSVYYRAALHICKVSVIQAECITAVHVCLPVRRGQRGVKQRACNCDDQESEAVWCAPTHLGLNPPAIMVHDQGVAARWTEPREQPGVRAGAAAAAAAACGRGRLQRRHGHRPAWTALGWRRRSLWGVRAGANPGMCEGRAGKERAPPRMRWCEALPCSQYQENHRSWRSCPGTGCGASGGNVDVLVALQPILAGQAA